MALAGNWALSDTTGLYFSQWFAAVAARLLSPEEEAVVETPSSSQSFLARHEFLIRRLHSLSGLVPVGAYMTIHLLTNSSILASSQKFQSLVYQIHGLGPVLPLVEWGFIFLPLIFHAVVGVVIVKGGMPNTGTYQYSSNIRYSLQRATGMIAFVFIFWHVFHMHGWIHADWWVKAVEGWGANFKPYNAASTAGRALASPLVLILYAIGVLSCVFHLANGLWTMGITWGLWVSPAAQRRANWIAIAFGMGLTAVSMGALVSFGSMSEEDITNAEQVEEIMFQQKVLTGEVEADSHKRAHPVSADENMDPSRSTDEASTRRGHDEPKVTDTPTSS